MNELAALLLLENKDNMIVFNNFSTRIYYSKENLRNESIINFLIHTGYLAYRQSDANPREGYIFIPNEEVKIDGKKGCYQFLERSF